MTDRSHRAGHVLRGSALAIGILLTAGCGDDGPAPAAPEDTEATATEAGTSAPSEIAVPRPEPADALATAIHSLGTTYEFHSELSTAAGDQVVITGHRIDNSLQYRVETGGAVLEVIAVDDAVWTRQDGNDEWLPSGENTTDDPLAPLAAPIEVAWNDTDPTQLVAAYQAQALGLDTDETIQVNVTIGEGNVSFESIADTTNLRSTLLAGTNLPPIAPPLS